MANKNLEFKIENLEFRIFVLVTILTIAFTGCSKSKNANNSVKFQQYYIQGEQLYKKHCSNCHQSTGTGLGRVYPPLYKSDYMDKNFESVLCLMKHGIQGELIVNEISFNQAMPGVPALTDLEIAEIATYIYNSWSHSRGLIEVSQVSQVINTCN